jgi:hypothetical protein
MRNCVKTKCLFKEFGDVGDLSGINARTYYTSSNFESVDVMILSNVLI